MTSLAYDLPAPTTRPPRHRRFTWATGLAIAAVVVALVVPPAHAFTQVGGHELDADLETDTDAHGDVDWAPNDGAVPGTGTAGAEEAIFDPAVDAAEDCSEDNSNRPYAVQDEGYQATLICDSVSFPGSPDANIFEGGAKEDDPDSQTTKSGPVTPKTDLTNAYARGVIAPDSGNNADPTAADAGDPDTDPDAWVVAAYEVIPKQGSYHTNVEFNQFVKCATGAEAGNVVDDSTDCGAGAQVVPFRTAGDVLLAVDIGGSNDPNKKIRLLGFVAVDDDADPTTNAIYNFGKNEAQTIANADVSAFGSAAGINTGVVKASINGAEIDCGPWGCYDDGYNFVGTLPAESFVEVAANLSAFTSSVCLNNVAFKSRASGQSVTSQLKDTTQPQPFPFCGGLSVKKYIDVDESGDISSGDITTQGADTEGDLSGWAFTVKDSGGATVCSGTTNSDGELVCTTGDLTQLAPGDYTIEETNAGKALASGATSFNTDPGGTSPFTKVETVTLGGDTEVVFGNTCRISKVFQVTGVPAGVSTLSAFYTVTNDEHNDNSSTEQTVALADTGGGTWEGTASETFTDDDALDWDYGVSSSDRATGGSHTFDAATEGYASCTTTNTVQFAPPTLTVAKYKDPDGNGLTNAIQGLAGWQFHLYRDGSNGTFDSGDGTAGGDDTFIETLTTADGSGSTTLGEAVNTVALAPGDYWVEEVTQTNWNATAPVPDGNGDVLRSISLTISQDGSVEFANTPLSRVKVEFEDLTGYTDATIDCDWTTEAPDSLPDLDSNGQTLETVSVSASNLRVGTHNCQVVITDP